MRLPRALHFRRGYIANLGLVAALAGRGGAVFSDGLNHASLIDARALSRAECGRTPTSTSPRSRGCSRLRRAREADVSDAVFSMDGDLAPLPRTAALCERHDAWLVVDDAHGFGVLGEGGPRRSRTSACASPRIAYMGTLGKAAGVHGAFVAGEEALIEWLVQRARTYIFTTAARRSSRCALIGEPRADRGRGAPAYAPSRMIGESKRVWGALPLAIAAFAKPPFSRSSSATTAAALELAEGLAAAASGCRRSARRPCRRGARGCASRSRRRMTPSMSTSSRPRCTKLARRK